MDQGGTVIVYTWMGIIKIPDIINSWFGTNWSGFNYFRTIHTQTAAGKTVFPAMTEKFEKFSIKCNMIETAPDEEKLWTTTDEHKTQSIVPMMAGGDSHAGSASVLMHKNAAGGR